MTEEAAVTKTGFIELFTGTLLAPASTFEHVRKECEVGYKFVPETFAVVVLVFGADGLRLSSPTDFAWAPLGILCDVSTGLTLWFTSFALIALLAVSFNAEMYKVRAALVCLGFSLLPWLFLGPITCLRNLLGPATALIAFIPCAWIFLLQLVAVNQCFGLKSWQTLCLALIIPSLLCTLQILQIVQVATAVLSTL